MSEWRRREEQRRTCWNTEHPSTTPPTLATPPQVEMTQVETSWHKCLSHPETLHPSVTRPWHGGEWSHLPDIMWRQKLKKVLITCSPLRPSCGDVWVCGQKCLNGHPEAVIVASLSQKTLSCLILRRRHREVHFSVLQLKFYCHWIHCAELFFHSH